MIVQMPSPHVKPIIYKTENIHCLRCVVVPLFHLKMHLWNLFNIKNSNILQYRFYSKILIVVFPNTEWMLNCQLRYKYSSKNN